MIVLSRKKASWWQIGSMLFAMFMTQHAVAALALDRTRVILNGNEESVSLYVSNQNKTLPFLAQAWIEDTEGRKVTDPMVALPPVQRIEPGTRSQIRIQTSRGAYNLAQDRESLYYFNLREIPPKSDKPNTLQIALQSRIKLFYRPVALAMNPNRTPWQEQLKLIRKGDKYVVDNPTPYYITLSSASAQEKGNAIKGFQPIMIPPKSSMLMGGSARALGKKPVLTYINDYGGRPRLIFTCNEQICHVTDRKPG